MGGVSMIRFLILLGYVQLMMYLQLTGKLNQYINIHYQYLAFLSMILALILAIVQLFKWVKAGDKSKEKHEHTHLMHNHGHVQEAIEEHSHDHHSHHQETHSHDDTLHHHHHHGMTKWYQKLIGYTLLCLPLLVGLCFPKVSLDTTIVEAKGFQFPLSKESTGDPNFQTQYLRPDTSIYFNPSDYKKQMDRLLNKYSKNNVLQVTDANYLELMEIIYNYPSEFIGKEISFEGFVYHSTKDNQQDLFLFRFGIIHCIADSGVFGLRVELPDNQTFKNDQWLKVTGKLSSQYYAPFKRELPVVMVDTLKVVEAPENQYVYRTF